MELFKVILQDYREAFRRAVPVKRDQGFFLCGQTLDCLHHLLCQIVSRESLPEEDDWDALLGFEFIDAQLLSIFQFMEKTEFRSKPRRAAKGRINGEKEKSKKSKTDVTASAVVGDMFNPHVNQGRAYFRYLCKEPLKHPDLGLSPIWWWGWPVLTIPCCLHYPGDWLWIVMPDCVRASLFVVGWPRS